MSLSRGCKVVKWTDGYYYCIVATDEHDYDYRDFTIYGPTNGVEAALNKIEGANPGGFTTVICKRQKDLRNGMLRTALRQYIKNGYKNTRKRVW